MRIDSVDSNPFSAKGDSGSAIVSDTVRDPDRVVALLGGGDPLHTYASPIAFVVNELNLEVATGDTKQFHEPVVVPSHEELLARLKSEQGKESRVFSGNMSPSSAI